MYAIGGLEALRHHHGDAVAALHAQRRQHVAQAIGLRLQLPRSVSVRAARRACAIATRAPAVGRAAPSARSTPARC